MKQRISDEWFAGNSVFELRNDKTIFVSRKKRKIYRPSIHKMQIDFHRAHCETPSVALCDLPQNTQKSIREIETFSARFSRQLFDVARTSFEWKKYGNYVFPERMKMNKLTFLIGLWSKLERGEKERLLAIQKITVNWAWKINYLSFRWGKLGKFFFLWAGKFCVYLSLVENCLVFDDETFATASLAETKQNEQLRVHCTLAWNAVFRAV